MRGGRTPIHIQRWAPADYQHDEYVCVLLARRDWMTLTFYRQFLDESFLAGGDLPADPECLAACLRMPARDVRKALSFCIGRLLVEKDGRLSQKRVKAEIDSELEFRSGQVESGRAGGQARARRLAQGHAKATPNDVCSPPAPAPAPAPNATAYESVADQQRGVEAFNVTVNAYCAESGRPRDEVLFEFSEAHGKRFVRPDTISEKWREATHSRIKIALMELRQRKQTARPKVDANVARVRAAFGDK